MHSLKIKRVMTLAVLLVVIGLAPVSIPAAPAHDNIEPPELPAPCESLQVQPGNRLAFRAYAVGVQIYRWNGTAWTFVEPEATLFADPNYHHKVGFHYLGPTWEGNSGGKVVATRVQGCTPNAAAIPWLLLQAVTNQGPGLFGSVTYIQRVNTVGGLMPTAPGRSVGAVAEVPYTAEYFFYRARD
jgi:hypothetical protein